MSQTCQKQTTLRLSSGRSAEAVLRPTRPTRPINSPRFRSRQLGNDSVDAVVTGDVLTGEEKLELLPPAEADDPGTRNITESSGVPYAQPSALFAHIAGT